MEGDKTEDNEAANLFEIRVSVRRMRYVLTQAKSLCLLLEVRTLITADVDDAEEFVCPNKSENRTVEYTSVYWFLIMLLFGK